VADTELGELRSKVSQHASVVVDLQNAVIQSQRAAAQSQTAVDQLEKEVSSLLAANPCSRHTVRSQNDYGIFMQLQARSLSSKEAAKNEGKLQAELDAIRSHLSKTQAHHEQEVQMLHRKCSCSAAELNDAKEQCYELQVGMQALWSCRVSISLYSLRSLLR
jgi:hypothetical protein